MKFRKTIKDRRPGSRPRPARQAYSGRRLASTVMLLVFLAPINLLNVCSASAGEREDKQEKEAAWAAYRANNYQQALNLITPVIDRGHLDTKDLHNAYILKGLCETDLNRNDDAVRSFVEAIRLDPSFRLEGNEYVAPEIQNFNQAYEVWRRASPEPLSTSSPRKKGALWTKPYFLASAGAVLVGAVLLFSKGDGETGPGNLPPFPGVPASSRP